MEASVPVEKRHRRETALQRLVRQTGSFFAAFSRLAVLAVILTPLLLIAFLSVDIPMRAFDGFFGANADLRPSNWLSRGSFIMALAPLIAILFARRYGGDEASRAITAAWGVAAVAVFAGLSYLAPALEDGDMPGVRFTVVFVGAAMAAQYIAVNVYDVARGGGSWWRAPLFGALLGYVTHAIIYFPVLFWGTGAPWLSWIVAEIAITTLIALAFLPIYGHFRRSLRPKGGFGGR